MSQLPLDQGSRAHHVVVSRRSKYQMDVWYCFQSISAAGERYNIFSINRFGYGDPSTDKTILF